jgi:uncharacterized membrane protein YdjX (TVP38/TMEM64 family)
MTTTPTAPRDGRAAFPWLKAALAVAALALLVVGGRRIGGYVPEFAAWVDSLGVWGPVVFALGYAVATVAFIPGSLPTAMLSTLLTVVGAP